MRVLEQFLIALGIKVDEQSFKKADAAFGGLTRSALQLGAVFAGKLAIDKVVGDFRNAGTQLDNFNRLTGLNTQQVQALGQAFTAMGGNANDAMGTFKKVQDLMSSMVRGPEAMQWAAEASKFGFDPDLILNKEKAGSVSEALANIAEGLEKLPLLQKRLAAQAMGFSDDEIRILMKGRAEVEKQLDLRGKIGVMSKQQVEDAARLTRALSNLDGAFTDIGNTIAGELTPAFAQLAEDFVEFYQANKDLIDSGLKEFFGGLADNIELVAVALTLMGGASALKGLAALKFLLSGGAAGAGAGAGAAAATGASAGLIFGGTVASVLYSSSLNQGEDAELMKNRLSRGDSEAVGASIDFFKSKGWTEEQAMGITANIQQESGFKHDIVGDGGQAYGLAQWHPDRQANFTKFSGKNIRESTALEQMEFIHHELTKGAEKAAGDRLRMAQSAYDAGSIVSKHYERPKDREGEATRRGELAQSYTPAVPQARSMAREVTDAELTEMRRNYGKADKPEESLLDKSKTWLDGYRERHRQEQQAHDLAQYRQVPQEYTVNTVVQPPQQSAVQAPAAPAAASAPVQNIDNRQFHIHGADTAKVEQLYNEKFSRMIEQTAEDFKGPER